MDNKNTKEKKYGKCGDCSSYNDLEHKCMLFNEYSNAYNGCSYCDNEYKTIGYMRDLN